jgi:hypothetical protein
MKLSANVWFWILKVIELISFFIAVTLPYYLGKAWYWFYWKCFFKVDDIFTYLNPNYDGSFQSYFYKGAGDGQSTLLIWFAGLSVILGLILLSVIITFLLFPLFEEWINLNKKWAKKLEKRYEK